MRESDASETPQEHEFPADPVTLPVLSEHGRVIVALARAPGAGPSELSGRTGLSVGLIRGILAQLETQCYIDRLHGGNRYRVNAEAQLRHPLATGHTLGDLLAILAPDCVGRLPI